MAILSIEKSPAPFAALVAELRDDPGGVGYPLDDPAACYRLFCDPDREAAPSTTRSPVSRLDALQALPDLVDAEKALRDAAEGDNGAAIVLDVWLGTAIDWSSPLGAKLLPLWPGLSKENAEALQAMSEQSAPKSYLPSRRAEVFGTATGTLDDVKAACAVAKGG